MLCCINLVNYIRCKYNNRILISFIFFLKPMWYKVNKRFIWTQQVRPSGWKPWSNTLAYYPFISDLKDYSGNWYDFTTYSWTTTFVNNMVQSTWVLRWRSLMSQLWNNFTISMYLLHAGDSCSLQDSDDMRLCTFVFWGWANGIDFNIRYNWNRYTTSYSLSPDNKIHHVVGTKENTTYKLYVDWELKSSNVYSYPIITDKAYFHLWNIGASITKKFWNLILEKTVWTAEQVANYNNQTKSLYSL